MDTNNLQETRSEAAVLRGHLFASMDRLSKADDPKALEAELKRADAIAKVGTVIVNSHKHEVALLRFMKYAPDGGDKPKEIGNGTTNQAG